MAKNHIRMEALPPASPHAQPTPLRKGSSLIAWTKKSKGGCRCVHVCAPFEQKEMKRGVDMTGVVSPSLGTVSSPGEE